MKTHGSDKARTAWTEAETRELISLYDTMRSMDRDGLLGRRKDQASKKDLILAWLRDNAPHRSRGSVEAKLMNISASCEASGFEILVGYKPLRNRAASLDALVASMLSACLLLMVAA